MFQRYFFTFFWVLTALIAATFAFNVTVDPYGIHGQSARFASNAKITKAFALDRQDPEIVLIGNSRNNYAMDVSQLEHEGWNAYNFSHAGIQIDEIRHLFSHALHTAPVRQAYISLDSLCSNHTISTSVDLRFLTLEGRRTNALKNRFLLDISYQSSRDSITVLNGQTSRFLSPNGQTMLFDEFDYQEQGSAHALKMREARAVKATQDHHLAGTKNYKDFVQKCDISELAAILEMARQHDVNLTFFFNPIHMRYWNIHFEAGQLEWRLYRRRLALETIQDFVSNGDMKEPQIFDFNLPNRFTTSALSPETASSSPYWYESSHFKEPVGRMMMDVFQEKYPLKNTRFATLLNRAELELHYKKNKQAFLEWRTQTIEATENPSDPFGFRQTAQKSGL